LSFIAPPAPPIDAGNWKRLLELELSRLIADLAISTNALSTEIFSNAEVSKYGMSPFSLHHCLTVAACTCLLDSLSSLLPMTTNGYV
jgi:hypothetical protein